MITVGLIKELFFISAFLKTPVMTQFIHPAAELVVRIEGKYVTLFYKGIHIWRELIDGPTSNFGIESCDNISRIIACIDNGTDWEKYKYVDNGTSP